MADRRELNRLYEEKRSELAEVQHHLNRTQDLAQREMLNQIERKLLNDTDRMSQVLKSLEKTAAAEAQIPKLESRYMGAKQARQVVGAAQPMRTMQTMGKRRMRQGVSMAKQHMPKIAAGAAGMAVGAAAAAHNTARSGLRNASNGLGMAATGYMQNRDKIHGGLFFILLAWLVIQFEFFAAGQNGNWISRIGVYFIVIPLVVFLFTKRWSIVVHTLMAGAVVNGIYAIYISGTQVSFLSDPLSGDIGRLVVSWFVLPGVLWWMLLGEQDQIEFPKWIKFGGTAVIMVTFLTLSNTALAQAGGVGPLPPGGFDSQAAAQDAFSFTLAGLGNGLGNVGCWLGLSASCSFADTWLGSITDEFAYDATTVHSIQNERLGVYVQDPRVEGSIPVTGYSVTSFLPKGVRFNIEAPIPPAQEFDLCNEGSDVKGFAGICKRTIEIECEIDDVGATLVQPESALNLRSAIASQGSLFTCRTQPPADDALLDEDGGRVTKTAQIKVTYPFATNTFKLIRAVDEANAYQRDVQEELNSFNEKTIISSGGPVIVETDESTFIPVRRDQEETRTPLLIGLNAIDGVRLDRIEQIGIYVPNGSRLETPQGVDPTRSYCQFVPADGEITIQPTDDLCADKDNWNIPDCRPYTTTVQEEKERNCQLTTNECARGAICEHAPTETAACNDLDNVFGIGADGPVRPGSFYYLSSEAVNRINADLGNEERNWRSIFDWTGSNSVEIACDLVIDEPDTFLYDNELVTERAVNIVSQYVVEHTQETSAQFVGSLDESIAYSNARQRVCDAPGIGSIPEGLVPFKNPTVYITDVFGTKRAGGSHGGIDFDVVGGDETIVASWAGDVVEVCRSESGCGEIYGHHVRVLTKEGAAKWTHLYAHLSDVSVSVGDKVRQGQRIGMLGNTGKSYGAHLHFEVDIDGVSQDPFPYIHRADRFADNDNYKTAIANAGVTCKQEDSVPADPYETVGFRLSTDSVCSGLTDANEQTIIDAAREWNLHPEFLFAIAEQETGCDHNAQRTWGSTRDYAGQWNGIAQSTEGALGMFQIMANNKDGANTYCSQTLSEYKKYSNSNYAEAQTDFRFHAFCAAEIAYQKWKAAYNNWDGGTGVTCPASYCTCPNTEKQRDAEYSPYTQTELKGYAAAAQGYYGWGCQPSEEQGSAYWKGVESHFKATGTSVDFDEWVVIS